MKKIVIFSDASSHKQINGVRVTIDMTKQCLVKKGYDVKIVNPDLYKLTIPLQPSTGIYMPLMPLGIVDSEVEDADHIHIATEGSIGLAARYACSKQKRKYTTSFHTKFPEYLYEHAYIPPRVTSRYFRWFHRSSNSVLVTTPSMVDYCNNLGIKNLKVWSRGVDTSIFKPLDIKKPTRDTISSVYVGRISAEKNLEAYLSIANPMIKKTLIGDGPQLLDYKSRYPDAVFLGKMDKYQIAAELPKHHVFAWPSLTDTFGLVVLEAMACGLPVAAFDNDVNRYIIEDGVSGFLVKKHLELAIEDAIHLDQEDVVARAQQFSWEAATDQFINSLV